MSFKLPLGLRLTAVPDKSLSDMLVAGELDAVIAAQPPRPFLNGHPNIARLFESYLEMERRYVQETKIMPIMHTVAIRKSIVDQNPWAVANLMTAFEIAKRNSVARALEIGVTRFPIPWCFDYARDAKDIWGDDIFPYGIDANHKTLALFLEYAYEQGVCNRRLSVEELFPDQVHAANRIKT